jgi:hypothetical protein
MKVAKCLARVRELAGEALDSRPAARSLRSAASARSRLNSACRRTSQDREQLPGRDDLAGLHLVLHGSRRRREQRRTDRRDYDALRGGIAHEPSFGHHHDPQPLARHNLGGVGPATQQETEQARDQYEASGQAEPSPSPWGRTRCGSDVLSGGVADQRGDLHARSIAIVVPSAAAECKSLID